MVERYAMVAHGQLVDARESNGGAWVRHDAYAALEASYIRTVKRDGERISQLERERDALAAALRMAVTALETYDYDPRNGATDPTGSIDEGAVRHGEMMEKFRALLAPRGDGEREEGRAL